MESTKFLIQVHFKWFIPYNPTYFHSNDLCAKSPRTLMHAVSSSISGKTKSHPSRMDQRDVHRGSECKRNPRNLILEGLFIRRHMLRFPPILACRRNSMHGFHQPSKMIFLIFRSLDVTKIWDLRLLPKIFCRYEMYRWRLNPVTRTPSNHTFCNTDYKGCTVYFSTTKENSKVKIRSFEMIDEWKQR